MKAGKVIVPGDKRKFYSMGLPYEERSSPYSPYRNEGISLLMPLFFLFFINFKMMQVILEVVQLPKFVLVK
ncbi:hypothetical protein D3C74_26510 [compost metagenome]